MIISVVCVTFDLLMFRPSICISAVRAQSHVPYSDTDRYLPVFSSLTSGFFVVSPLRLIVRSGNSSLSTPLFDSDLDDVPERGLLSESSTLYLELTADSSSIPLLLALRYEGEQRDFTKPACIFFLMRGLSKT